MRPRKDGKPLYEHLAKAAESLGEWPKGFEPIDPPEEAEFVWKIFWELRERGKSGFAGAEALGFMELDAWQRVRGVELAGPVVDMILAMDGAYLAEWRREEDSRSKGRKPGRRRK